jgi:hypothetical protein
LIVIDEIPPELLRSGTESRRAFDRIVSSILDFCPKLYLVLTSRIAESNAVIGSIQLRPLDISEVATYIAKHPRASQDLVSMSVIDELYMRSDGLPMH